MNRISFKKFVTLRETAGDKDWRAESARQLPKGFIPPKQLRPIIQAFLQSDKIVLMHDTSGKPVSMPKKSLFLVGGPVRDFVAGRTIKDYDLATNATPEQIATILASAGFKQSKKSTKPKGDTTATPEDGDTKKSDLNLPHGAEDPNGKPITFDGATTGDNLTWFVKGKDSSGKAFVVGAVVDGMDFDIATFRKDKNVVNGDAEVEFTDNPKDDASRRDMTINAMYIELTKPDGENKGLFDPTGHGLYHLQNGIVKTVGKADDRFDEDPIRIMRAIRFSSKYGKGSLDPEIKRAIPKFHNIDERVAIDRIADEFKKGLLDPDVNLVRYIDLYKETGLIEKVLRGVKVTSVSSIPEDWRGKNDHVLALAWILQNNPSEQVSQALQPNIKRGEKEVQTGWLTQEFRAVMFLLSLREFNADAVRDYIDRRKGTGLSAKQVRDWVDMIGSKIPNRDHARRFADYETPTVKWDQLEGGVHDKCPTCRGNSMFSSNCSTCNGTGRLPERQRSGVVKRLEADAFRRQK